MNGPLCKTEAGTKSLLFWYIYTVDMSDMTHLSIILCPLKTQGQKNTYSLLSVWKMADKQEVLVEKWEKFENESDKGQLNSEWIYEVIVSPKMPIKNFKDFCPTL